MGMCVQRDIMNLVIIYRVPSPAAKDQSFGLCSLLLLLVLLLPPRLSLSDHMVCEHTAQVRDNTKLHFCVSHWHNIDSGGEPSKDS